MAEISQREDLQRESDPEEPLPFRAFTRKRIVVALLVSLTLVLLVVVPPLFNVSRYKRQIASSIGASIGRPVHIDNVTLNLLPLPGFTLEHFVVGEDPAFGAEPVLRADEVRATLRVSSLWRRRLEFSRIALTDPSINLVHLPDGRWNLESILLQASRMPAAPTAQRTSGEAPRFPYIEASGARINLKLALEKTPFSLTDADAALWLPEPAQWHLRLKAHPTRTDTAVSDTGVLRLDGTLSHAATLMAVPLDMHADWTAVPLGALSWILAGHDAGMRGVMNLHAALAGTLSRNTVQTQLSLENVRRADFVPQRSLSAGVQCTAQMLDSFHAVGQAHCAWPSEPGEAGMTADLNMPDTLHPSSAIGTAQLKNVPASALLDILRAGSNRISPELEVSGLISGAIPYGSVQPDTPLAVENSTLTLPGQTPFVQGTLSGTVAGRGPALSFVSIPLNLGGRTPANLSLQVFPAGVHMQLTGEVLRARVLALAEALPQFGDDLAQALPPAGAEMSDAPLQIDLVGERGWLTGLTWKPAGIPPSLPHKPARRRHR